MAYMEFLNPRRDSPYASRTKHPISKPRKPLVWQNDMAEVRETYRRVANVKDTAYTGFSCLDPARTASTLSKNRVARRAMQHSFEPMDYLNSSTPYEAFQHVQNVRKMCKRIQSLGSLAERKKNPWDVGLYPALIRRPSTACPVRHPICHRGNGPTRPFSVPTFTNRTPRCYSSAQFSTLLDISNKPEQACHACHFKAPYDRPSQQDKSYHSRSAVYNVGMGRSRPSSPSQDLSRLTYLPNTSTFPTQHTNTPASTNVYLSHDHEDLLEMRPPALSEKYLINHHQYANQLQDQTSSKVLIAKPIPEKKGTKVERRYPRGQTGNHTLGSSSLEQPTLDTDYLTDRVLTDSDSSSETEKIPPRRSRMPSSKKKDSTVEKFPPLETRKPSKRSMVKQSRASSRVQLPLERPQLLLERPPSRLAMNRSNLSSPCTECSSPKSKCEDPACARIDDVNSSQQNVKFEGASDIATTSARGDPEAEDLKEKEGFYESGEGGVMVKHSTDPYSDFKSSMMNMIIEENLQNRPTQIEELFQYYLDLNPGLHHKVIQRVIKDIRKELKNKGMM